MKSLLLASASVFAVVLGLSGSASAQAVDIGDLADTVGGLVDGVTANVEALNSIDVGALNGIGDLPENAGVGGVYLNTAVNVAPQLATNVNLAAPLDVNGETGLGGLVGALAVGLSPNTASGAVAIDTSGIADIIASVGSSITTGDQTSTAVGVLANQATQNATTTVATLTDNSNSTFNGGTINASDEATQAAASAGSAASSAAARYTTLDVVGPNSTLNNDIDAASISGALTGVYAANTALNVAPQIAANINAATNITTGDLASTAVGVLANQTISIGLDGAALSGSLTGNGAAAAAN